MTLSKDIGRTERTLRALLDRHLDDAGLSFPEWVAFVFLDDGPLPAGEIVRRQLDGHVATEAGARAAVDGLVAGGLVAPTDGGLALTADGEARFRPVEQAIARVGREIWAGLDTADLDATRRTLDEVTRRAGERLAGL